jgi:CRAL/TRIO domain
MPSTVQYIANFAMKHMPDKLRERVKFYSAADEIDCIEKKILPKEYGGEVYIEEMLCEFLCNFFLKRFSFKDFH